jgi:hypothetical protein
MRVGELKQILNKVITDSNQIEIKQQSIYGGQAYEISNFESLIDALDALNEQDWNTLDYSHIDDIKAKYVLGPTAQITNAEYDQLNSYTSSINQQLPIFIGFINSYTRPQDEQVINVKLPPDIKTLESLDEVNKKLENIFKILKISGKIEFQGFDKGSDWYILLITNPENYKLFLLCLEIATEIFNLKRAKALAESAEIELKAAASIFEKKYDAKLLENFINSKAEQIIEEKVNEAVEKIKEKNGHEVGDLTAKALKGTKELIKVLGDDVEFHLSLNPPAYATETAGGLTIDYKKMPSVSKPKETKQLPPADDQSQEGKPEE